jgi:hypothetical protein
MRTVPRRRLSWAAGALAVVLGIPALAEAQLFPNLTIKRERVPCCNENPIYGLYRRQYYGYFPTCWRRFPPGWGCPSPEVANSAAAMEEVRRQLEQEAAEMGQEEEPGMEGPDQGERPPFPAPDRVVPLPEDNPPPFGPPGTPPPSNPNRPQAMRDGSAPDDGPAPIDVPARAASRRAIPASPSLPPLDESLIIPEPDPTIGDETSLLPGRAPTAPRRTLVGGMVESLRGRRRR